MEKFYLSKALLAGGGDASPNPTPTPLDPLLTGTLLFQTDDNRVSPGRMRYVLFYLYGRTSLATSYEDTTSVGIVAGKLV